MKQSYVTCDVCWRRVDWIDSNGDDYAQGFTFYEDRPVPGVFIHGVQKTRAVRVPLVIHAAYSQRQIIGADRPLLNGLHLENVCSPACLRKAFEAWLDHITEITGPLWATGKATRNFIALDGPCK